MPSPPPPQESIYSISGINKRCSQYGIAQQRRAARQVKAWQRGINPIQVGSDLATPILGAASSSLFPFGGEGTPYSDAIGVGAQESGASVLWTLQIRREGPGGWGRGEKNLN